MADGTEAGSEYLERAQGLAPLIEASADQAERERRLPEPLFTALVEAGLFRLLLPRSLDGTEVDPVTFVRVVEDIAKRDGFKQPLRESAVVQSQVALAEARLGSARTFLLAELGEIWRAVGRAGALALDQRVRIRLAATHAMQEAKDVVDGAYHAAGATAIFQGSGFERRFRDMHAVTQQLQGRVAHYETVGRFLLGLETDTSFL